MRPRTSPNVPCPTGIKVHVKNLGIKLNELVLALLFRKAVPKTVLQLARRYPAIPAGLLGYSIFSCFHLKMCSLERSVSV